MAPNNSQKRKLLVIGDWLFDEQWVTGEHRGAISSHVGGDHLRALHEYGNSLCRLAGAGQAACFLSCALNRKDRKDRWNFIGAGVWDECDTTAIKAMLRDGPCPRDTHSPYRITRTYDGDWSNGELFNIGKVIETKLRLKSTRSDNEEPDQTSYRCGTMRAIRVYRYKADKLQLKERIDWDMPIPQDKSTWIGNSENAILRPSDLKDLGDLVKDAKAIVVQDMKKGVLSTALVKWLTKVAPDAEWYISTKAWLPAHEPAAPEQPDWLSELERDNMQHVRLLVIPRSAAKRAVDEGLLNCWITKNRVPSREALGRIDELHHRFTKSAIVVMTGNLTVLARSPGSQVGLIQSRREMDSAELDDYSAEVSTPITTVSFPSMVAWLLHQSPDKTLEPALKQARLELALKRAIGVTHAWRKEEIEAITRSEEKQEKRRWDQDFWHPREFGVWDNVDWDETTSEWDQALRECGIIHSTKQDGIRPRIELWRAMTDIDGYVSCVPSRSAAIRRIRGRLDQFKKEPRPRHSVSFMLMAAPGSGKTHLVKQIANSCNFSLLQFNITQMLSKNDLLDCFDTIVTLRAQANRPLLVFFDEINARLSGQHVYDSFLAPLEDSIFIRAGKMFQMPCCAWLFAGTDNPADSQDKSAKGSDFVSRLSIPPINFEPEAGEEADLNTERVYLGLSLLKQSFPDVREVSEKVLKAFAFLRPNIDIRQIKHLVESFVDIQHEKVLSRNISIEQLKGLTHPHIWNRHHFNKWTELPEGDNVMVTETRIVADDARLHSSRKGAPIPELRAA